MDLKTSIEGLDDLKKAFSLLPQKVAVKAASKAVAEGAKVIQKAARAKVPVDTGNLKRSITYKVLNKKRDALQVAALVGPGSGYVSKRGKNKGKKMNDGFYGYFVEYGTKQNFQFRGYKAMFESGLGSPPQPFMRPAFDHNKVTAQQAIVDVIGPAIESEANKLYKGQ